MDLGQFGIGITAPPEIAQPGQRPRSERMRFVGDLLSNFTFALAKGLGAQSQIPGPRGNMAGVGASFAAPFELQAFKQQQELQRQQAELQKQQQERLMQMLGVQQQAEQRRQAESEALNAPVTVKLPSGQEITAPLQKVLPQIITGEYSIKRTGMQQEGATERTGITQQGATSRAQMGTTAAQQRLNQILGARAGEAATQRTFGREMQELKGTQAQKRAETMATRPGLSNLQTIYDPSGQPSTVVVTPSRSGVQVSPAPLPGGGQGLSKTPPPTVPASTSKELAELKTAIQGFQDVQPALNKVFGPVVGAIKLAEINKLKGVGATPEEIDLANKLQRLLTTQAFANGGKQLTITELAQFEKLTPTLQDTVQSALVKTRNALEFLNRAYKNRIEALPIRQRQQLQESAPGGKTPEQELEEYKRKKGIK